MIGKSIDGFGKMIKTVFLVLTVTIFLLIGFVFMKSNDDITTGNKEIIKTETIIKDGDTTIINHYK